MGGVPDDGKFLFSFGKHAGFEFVSEVYGGHKHIPLGNKPGQTEGLCRYQ